MLKHIRDILTFKRAAALSAAAVLGIASTVLVMTWASIRPVPESLDFVDSDVRKVQLLDRSGKPLTVTYQNRWNIHDYVPLHEVPGLLQQAFIEAEDKRFYSHGGVDWKARVHAAWQNATALSVVRGASTISEQAVRMLHPRPRTVWSRWVEGVEARMLEKRFSKAAILEFYLNQVPYTAQRRGVVQAARYYFDRDLDTLSPREMLSLAVLVRAPGRMDLYSGKSRIEKPIAVLASRMLATGIISGEDHQDILSTTLTLSVYDIPVQAGHFAHHIYHKGLDSRNIRGRLVTTLDTSIQEKVQRILDARLRDLRGKGVGDGAALAIDHRTGEVLAWVNGGGYSDVVPGGKIDAVTTPRQPGSTLKPFLYAMALEKGWTAATLIDDSELSSPVGTGIHSYRNYSGQNYGPLRLREALGNSLNIPAIRAVQFVGVDEFLARLRTLGFESLTRHPEFYGEGLALGNGEVTLLELTGAYAALAREGTFQPLVLVRDEVRPYAPGVRSMSVETSSIIADILSDPEARSLEFGSGNLLRFPTQTAVKTGTSTDYRDAWAVGFSSNHTVGVWMGNLDGTPMKEVTGSTGPALALRAIFAELNRLENPRPLYVNEKLRSLSICSVTGKMAGDSCPSMEEWFVPESEPVKTCSLTHEHTSGSNVIDVELKAPAVPEIIQPTQGVRLARDPRIPDELEAFPFLLSQSEDIERVEWVIDGDMIGTSIDNMYMWPLERGTHTLKAKVWSGGNPQPAESMPVTFHVR